MTNTNRQYEIRTLQPLPSMSEDVFTICGTYKDAVAACHAQHRLTGRTCSVVSNGVYWHRVSNGMAVDRNTNSGIQSGAIA